MPYRLLKAHDLITSPAYVVIKAADQFHTKTTRPNEMWQPWIVSQSLAIVRVRPDGPICSPNVLNAILTAPWVREKLESMSGGSTVRTLPISALRSLVIPVPAPEEQVEAMDLLIEVSDLRLNVAELERNINETRSAIWHSLWHVAPELGDE